MDITPKYNLTSAKDKIVVDEIELGERIGGMNATSSSFSRGAGDDIFKITSRGVHIGNANFGDAPFRVDMNGVVSPITIQIDELTNSHFYEIFNFVGSTTAGNSVIWVSDGTSPDLVLVGSTGHICLNADGGKTYYCTGTNNWTAM